MKKTLVLGASPDNTRYSFRAVQQLAAKGYEVVPVGVREGEVAGLKIIKGMPPVSDVHTVTMYIGAKRQPEYYDYLLGLNPKRIIFNPGAENQELFLLARQCGIEVLNACTLVMLGVNTY